MTMLLEDCGEALWERERSPTADLLDLAGLARCCAWALLPDVVCRQLFTLRDNSKSDQYQTRAFLDNSVRGRYRPPVATVPVVDR